MNYIDNTIKNLNNICLECKDNNACMKEKCNIGLALNIMEIMENEGTTVIAEGTQIIPKEDTKFYDERMIAKCIASISKLCKSCNSNHTERCSISIARKSLEGVVLQDTLIYPGNALSYFANVSKQNAEFAGMLMEEFKNLKD